MQSIQDLRVVRENMLMWINEEMQKLLVDTTSKHIAEDHYSKVENSTSQYG